MSTVTLVLAVLASLAVGVMVAYGVCLTMFRALRFHSGSLTRQQMGESAVRAIQGYVSP